MEPRAESLRFPEGYGTPTEVIAWPTVRSRLEESERYWLATTRPDGRPHVVPVDGVWLDGACYFGGHPDTVHQRNLATNADVQLHLDDSMAVVIAEGRAEFVAPTREDAARLAAASKRKYGYAPPVATYLEGVWRVQPARVLAWNRIDKDATRFTF